MVSHVNKRPQIREYLLNLTWRVEGGRRGSAAVEKG